MCVLHSVYKCRFIWSERWSLLEKALGQCWHWKGFAPVCFRICLVSSSERANLQLHPSQEQWYGFSPKEFGEKNSITYSIHCVVNNICNLVTIWSFLTYLYEFACEPSNESFLYIPYCNQGICIYAFFYVHLMTVSLSYLAQHLAYYLNHLQLPKGRKVYKYCLKNKLCI